MSRKIRHVLSFGTFQAISGPFTARKVKDSVQRQAAGGRSSVLTASQAVAVEGKEVVIEDEGDAQQGVGVDGALLEEEVDVGTAERKLPGEPHDAVAALVKALPDEPAYVYLHDCRTCI